MHLIIKNVLFLYFYHNSVDCKAFPFYYNNLPTDGNSLEEGVLSFVYTKEPHGSDPTASNLLHNRIINPTSIGHPLGPQP